MSGLMDTSEVGYGSSHCTYTSEILDPGLFEGITAAVGVRVEHDRANEVHEMEQPAATVLVASCPVQATRASDWCYVGTVHHDPVSIGILWQHDILLVVVRSYPIKL
jgi:hypothetical protein